MRLVRYNPNRSLFNFGNPINMDDLFPAWCNSPAGDRVNGLMPKVDIYEEKEGLVMTAELPGVEKENITIDIKGNVLTLKGERSAEETDNGDTWYRRERTFGSFERAFELPEDVDPEKIRADYKDGVLKLSIPKAEKVKPKRITVH